MKSYLYVVPLSAKPTLLLFLSVHKFHVQQNSLRGAYSGIKSYLFVGL